MDDLKIIDLTKCKIDEKTGKYICPYCEKESSKYGIKTHIWKTHIEDKQEKQKINNEKHTCPYCGKEFFKYGIKAHIWRVHTEEGKKFDPNSGYQNGTRKAWNKGLTTETDSRVKKGGETFRKKLESGEIKNWWLNRKHTEEAKKKISESMKIAHKEHRAHNIGECRWKCEPSYPEQFFIKVIENEFHDQNYIREYYILGYSLDFAWVDKKLEIEIDGEQHEMLENQIRDQRRDQILKENGWENIKDKMEGNV